MRRTLFEVWRLCQKAAEGAGAPAGLDIAAADGALWLLARGLDVLDGYTRAVEALDVGAGACTFDGAPDGAVLDATGHPGALVAPALVDLVIARGGGPLTITGMSAPLFLLPPAARYAEDGWHLRFALHGPGGARFALVASAGAGPAIHGLADGATIAAALAGPAEFAVEADATPPGGAPAKRDEGTIPCLVDASALAAAAAVSVAEGIVIEATPWARLQAFADRTLVPATDESRRRGAGAEVDDNE